MIIFPSNPATNDIFPALDQPAVNGRRWKYNGTAWDSLPLPTSWTEISGKPTEFAPASHNHDDRYYTKTENDTLLSGKQPIGSYATLNIDGKIPSTQLPSFVDDVVEFADLAAFPQSGESGKIYVSLDSLKTYRWSGSAYVEISASPGSTDAVPEGSTNLYYTKTRVLADAPVTSVSGKTGDIVLTPSDIQGLGGSLAGAGAMTADFVVKAVSQGSYNDGNVIPAGTSLETVVKNMLQQRISASYAQPGLGVSTPASLYPEIGTNVSTSINTSWYPGNAGAATQFRLKKDGTLVQTTPGATPASYAASFQLLANTSFFAEVDYQQGAQLYDNLGDPSGSPIPAGSRTSNTITFVPLRASFYGADGGTSAAATSANVRALGNAALGLNNGSTFTLSIPAGTRRVTIAYPGSLRALNSVKYVELGNGEVADTFVQSSVSVEGANGAAATSYRVYTYIPAIPFGAAATYTVTI